jgi:hypothetical protein
VKKKTVAIAGLAVLVLAQAVVAWNARLRWRGGAAESDPAVKVRLLRRAEAVFPWNGEVSFELGRAYFSRGVEALGDPAARDRWFGLSVAAFLRSLRLDPGSSAAHFELAQTLLYMSYLGLPAPLGYIDEYRRAAELTGHNSQTHYDVGKVLLGRWEALSAADRDFVAGLLKGALAGKGEERLADFLEAWNLAGRDQSLLDRVLPEDAPSLRTYADFVGERGLPLEARWSALARAEALEVAGARAELDEARRDADAFRTADASARCADALKALGPVRFYQRLAGLELFAPKDYQDVLTGARRLLAMERIEETRSLADADGTIAAYVALEDDFTALGEFETFIKERGLLDESKTDSPFKDLQVLAFRMGLDFKLNRYRDITRVGSLLQSSSLIIAPSGRTSYAAILRLIGEANLKLDNVYEAERYYQMAQAAAPDDLAVLLGLGRCYGRLNDEARAAEVRQAVTRLTSPAVIDLGGKVLAKGASEPVTVVTVGGPLTFRLDVAPAATPGRPPLITVLAGGRVAWEGIGDTGSIEFVADPGPGRFSLEIIAVSGPARLERLSLAARAAERRPN